MQLQEAYDMMLDLQNKLHSEYAMSADLDEVYNQNLKQRFVEQLINKFIIDKYHYSRIFFMKHFSTMNDLPINLKSLKNDKLSQEKEIPSIFSTEEGINHTIKLFDTLIELKDKGVLDNLIDFISYSLIPSFYLMFIDDKCFKEFCKLISKFKNQSPDENLHYLLSRSIFVSPMFLRFFRKSTYHILNPICCQNSPPNFGEVFENFITRIQDQLVQSFKENICFVPSYINSFLAQMKDTKGFLTHCLFTPLFENPDHFLFFDASITDSKIMMDKIKSFVKLIFTDNIIESIANIFDKNKNSEKSLFVHRKDSTLPEVYKKVISSLDVEAINQIKNFLETDNQEINLFEKIKNKDLLFHPSLFEDEEEDQRKKVYQSTQANMGNCWMQFRKLLKESPPLPPNYKLPEEEDLTKESFLNLVRDLLLETGDPFTSINAEITFTLFEQAFINNREDIYNSDDFKDKMDNLVKSHREQSIAMKEMSQFRSELEILSFNKKEAIDLVHILFDTKLTYSIQTPADLQDLPTRSYPILDDPVKYNKLYQNYFNKQYKKVSEYYNANFIQIFYNRFFKTIRFNQYCAYRKDLAKYDEAVSESFTHYITYLHPENNEEHFKKQSLDAIRNIDVFTNLINKFNQAFDADTDPITKLKDTMSAMDEITGLFNYKFFQNTGGEDDKQPFRSLIIAYANPPRFYSNLIYLLEFVNDPAIEIYKKDNSQAKSSFVFFNTAVEGILKEVNNTLLIWNPTSLLARTHRKNIQFYITGNDPDLIIDTYKGFMRSSRSRSDLSNEVLDQLKENVKLSIPFHTNVKYMMAKDQKGNNQPSAFYHLLFISGLIGQEIQYNPSEDAKLCVYLYRYTGPSKLFQRDPPGKKNFLNTDVIPNEHKIFAYYSDDEIPSNELNIGRGIQVTQHFQLIDKIRFILNSFDSIA